MWVQPLGQEDPLERGMVTHSSILAWRITWTEEPGGLQSTGSHRVRHNWSNLACTRMTFLSINKIGMTLWELKFYLLEYSFFFPHSLLEFIQVFVHYFKNIFMHILDIQVKVTNHLWKTRLVSSHDITFVDIIFRATHCIHPNSFNISWWLILNLLWAKIKSRCYVLYFSIAHNLSVEKNLVFIFFYFFIFIMH